MSRLVLDTNCLIQIVSPRSKYHSLWDSFVRGENTLCVSNEIIEEYVEIMQKLMGFAAAEYVVKTILNSKFTEMITPFYNFNLIEADKDDNKFVDCAIAANASLISSRGNCILLFSFSIFRPFLLIPTKIMQK